MPSMAIVWLLAVAHMPATRRSLLQSLPAAAAVGAVGAHASRAAALSAAPLAVAAAPSAGSEFYSGLLAGAVQKTVKELALHPLDTVKARLQVATGRRALLSELFAAPYAGLTPALVSGAPAASAFFAVKDAVKRSAASSGLSKTPITLLSVGAANVAYWGVKNPSEVLKVRRQAGVTNDTLGAASDLWRNEGLGGFYSSYGSNYAYSTPVDVIKFLLYEQVKGRFNERRQGGALSPIEAAVG